MRILIVDAYYPGFLAHALETMDVATLPYREMLNKLLRLRFGTADFYSRHLGDLGHEADDIIFNCGPLQRRWAEEQGLAVGRNALRIPARIGRLPLIRRWVARNDSFLEIALRQIRQAGPTCCICRI